jgi:DNA-binding transcriptional MerR regulator
MTMSGVTFAIGEVADMLGLSPHTIRAWERRHLLASPMRTAAGQRRYTADDVELLRQIKHGRHALGFSIRVATMAAQGMLVPEARDVDPPGALVTEVEPDGQSDPLRRIVDLVSDVVVVVDIQGRIRHANTAFVRFCDVLPAHLQGLHFPDFVDPFDRAKAVQAYHVPLRPRRGWEFGLRTRRRRALFTFDCWPLPSLDGPVLALIGHQLDLAPPAMDTFGGTAAPAALDAALDAATDTGRRASPAAVRDLLQGVADPVRTLELLRPWLDATPVGVVLTGTDPDLTALIANDAFRRLARPGIGPVEGRPWRDLAPAADAGRLVAAAREVAGSAQRRTVTGQRPPPDDPLTQPPTIWDVDLCPVVEVGGAVTHLLLTVRDATAEVAVTRRLDALASCAPELRQASDARQVLATAARHARSLLPDADSLVAVAGGDQPGLHVVAADGVWTRCERDADRELRLALVRDVVRTGASIEIEREPTAGAAETVRAVPLLADPTTPGPGRVLGAMAFSRAAAGPFSAADRLLVDEFAGRVGMALGQAELLSDPAADRARPPASGS